MSVQNVKHKLGIPEANEAHDDHVEAAFDAARLRIIERTRLDLDGEFNTSARVDIFRNVRSSASIYLTRRPVAAVNLVEFRGYSATPAWGAAAGDLVDAVAGELILTSQTQPFWPPQDEMARWRKWRLPILPAVRVTYTTAAYETPEDLLEAIEDLAAYWYGQARANVAASASFGGISKTFRNEAMPEWIIARLAPYEVARRAAVV